MIVRVIAAVVLLGCGPCAHADLPRIEVRGATDALSFEEWRWATDERRQLVAEIDYDGSPIHDVICVFYAGQKRVAVDGIPGHRFDESGHFRRRFPIRYGRSRKASDIGRTTKLVIHVNRTEQDAHRAVREHGLVPQGVEAPAKGTPSAP